LFLHTTAVLFLLIVTIAILEDFPGLEIYIEVNGEQLKEYWDPLDIEYTPLAVGRYIEAKPGKAFKDLCNEIPSSRTNTTVATSHFTLMACIIRKITSKWKTF
jgi:hypothetical protein